MPKIRDHTETLGRWRRDHTDTLGAHRSFTQNNRNFIHPSSHYKRLRVVFIDFPTLI